MTRAKRKKTARAQLRIQKHLYEQNKTIAKLYAKIPVDKSNQSGFFIAKKQFNNLFSASDELKAKHNHKNNANIKKQRR